MRIICCVKPIKEEKRTIRLVQGNAIGVGNMFGKILESFNLLTGPLKLLK